MDSKTDACCRAAGPELLSAICASLIAELKQMHAAALRGLSSSVQYARR